MVNTSKDINLIQFLTECNIVDNDSIFDKLADILSNADNLCNSTTQCIPNILIMLNKNNSIKAFCIVYNYTFKNTEL